jgi:hypothetical protein
MYLEIREGLLKLWVRTWLLFEIAEEGLYLQVLIDFGDIHSEGELLRTVLCLPSYPQHTQKDVTAQITIGLPLGCPHGYRIFLNLKADDLCVGLLFPCCLIAEDSLFECGDVVVEKLCKIEHFLEERNGNAFATVMQHYQCFWLLDLFQVQLP